MRYTPMDSDRKRVKKVTVGRKTGDCEMIQRTPCWLHRKFLRIVGCRKRVSFQVAARMWVAVQGFWKYVVKIANDVRQRSTVIS